jgi:hydrogenase nickel incorporation protein HypA/HybF
MHEMALCEGILNVLKAEAQRQSFARVKKVWLEVGPFSGAEPEALKFCYDAVTRGSLAERSQLEVISSPGTAFCFDCLKSVAIAVRQEPCPDCGGHRLQVTGGEELKIKELEVE